VRGKSRKVIETTGGGEGENVRGNRKAYHALNKKGNRGIKGRKEHGNEFRAHDINIIRREEKHQSPAKGERVRIQGGT